jgi:hypothetical protein
LRKTARKKERTLEDESRVSPTLSNERTTMKPKTSVADPRFFDIDEMKDPVLALKVLDDHLAKVLEEPLYWKWAILALHNALQGFMVLNLADSTRLNLMQEARSCPDCHREVSTAICPGCGNEIKALNKRSWGSRSEWNNYYRSLYEGPRKKREVPKDWRLIPFLEMFGRIKSDKYMKRFSGSKRYQPSKRQKKSVTSLHNDLRNEFIHFRPKLLSDYAPALVSEVKEILPIILFLAFESGNIFWQRGGHDLENTARELLEKLGDRVAMLEKAYQNHTVPRLQPS